MKVALIILSLAAVALAGPTLNKDIGQNDDNNQYLQQQQQQSGKVMGELKHTQATETLKKWCFSSQMSQQELTAAFKQLVSQIKSAPVDQSTEAYVMSERICQGALVEKSSQNGQTVGQTGADPKAHELIKDVYLDALVACKAPECTKQLVKIVNSNKVDPIRAAYYMTRIAVTEKDSIKSEQEIKQLAESLIQEAGNGQSESLERQRLFAVTSILGKIIKQKDGQIGQELKQTVQQVCQTIVERFVKPIGQQEIQTYLRQAKPQPELAKKVAKRNAALKALANIPGHVLKEIPMVEQVIVEIVQRKDIEMTTVRQSAIECLEQNDKQVQLLEQITYDQEEPVEVRVAAYRALLTAAFAAKKQQQQQPNQQLAQQILDKLVKHCERQQNQQQDQQFVLYVISHLDNIRTSQQPELQAIKECIAKNKQHFMQIQLLCKKFKQQLNDFRKSSRNYKLEQEFDQIESGLIVEGDLVYPERKSIEEVMPKLIRVNVSMPVMGKTVNVAELTLRQSNLNKELEQAWKLVQEAKLNGETVNKMVESLKQSATEAKKNNKQVEVDLAIKVDGVCIFYMCADDFKHEAEQMMLMGGQRRTRSVYQTGMSSIFDDIIEHLKRNPIAFNRGFNFHLNQRLAKLLDVEATLMAGLRFESRAQGVSSRDYEIVSRIEPRINLEAIVGPAQVRAKKLLQRVSHKSALGLRLRYKQDELVDVQLELPMTTMELFTVESQIVERNHQLVDSYNYLPSSIYGQEDIYSPRLTTLRREMKAYQANSLSLNDDIDTDDQMYRNKRSLLDNFTFNTNNKRNTYKRMIVDFFQAKNMPKFTKRTLSKSLELPEEIVRMVGLRPKVRLMVAPKDAALLCQCLVEKYEPEMQGYRFQKVARATGDHQKKEFMIQVSTPGSRYERTVQVRLVQQFGQQRSLIKADVQYAKLAASGLVELVHDGRQYAVKAELASTRGMQFRHQFECGLQRGSQSAAGRIATTYKPYLSIVSSSLRRPIQLQGAVSLHQQQPKTVITYELKCPTSGNFVQGKVILEERSGRRLMAGGIRATRTMRSPIELLLASDLTLNAELVGQLEQHALKVHKLLDWDAARKSLKGDLSLVRKNVRKNTETHYELGLKMEPEQQLISVERRCEHDQRKHFNFQLVSKFERRAHQFQLELKRNQRQQPVYVYKHTLDVQQMSPKKVELVVAAELVDTEHRIEERLTGRTLVDLVDRRHKLVKCDLQNGQKRVKLNVDFVSLMEHLVELELEAERLQHKSQVRADSRLFNVQSRTDYENRMLAKLMLELYKPEKQCKIVLEVPSKDCQVAADLKLRSGDLSSLAIMTGRFASKLEFTLDQGAQRLSNTFGGLFKRYPMSLKLKSDLRDRVSKEAYWIDSSLSMDPTMKSFVRFDSPLYRSEMEFEPSELSANFGMFRRHKRSTNLYDNLYSNDDSIFYPGLANKQLLVQPLEAAKLNLANKLWMVRSMLTASNKLEGLKEKVRRALFEYADRRQEQRHYFDYSPIEDKLTFDLVHKPNVDYQRMDLWEPSRLSGVYQRQSLDKPSKVALKSQYLDLDFETKPYGEEQTYARLSAVSRHRRSPFKKHDSEVSYDKKHGYKAYVKHEDQDQKRHHWQLEADQSPKKWTKFTMDSDKHGKTHYEHNWRKYLKKRDIGDLVEIDTIGAKANIDADDLSQIYANKVQLMHVSPLNKLAHKTVFEWDEPRYFARREPAALFNLRLRRDLSSLVDAERRYGTVDYLKHVSARLQSQHSADNNQIYDLDFDYKPSEKRMKLDISLPEEMLHSSLVEFEPTEKVYKLQSKLLNKRNKEIAYQLLAQTKPVMGLASQEQEPVFFNNEHEFIESPELVRSIFGQPLKVDYSDKFGRVARLDYDRAPLLEAGLMSGPIYTGLRQKRAAVYYKDEQDDIEHDTTFDFFPETMFGRYKKPISMIQHTKQPGHVVLRTQTKYGPVKVVADTGRDVSVIDIVSPLYNVKLTTEGRVKQLIKIMIDNKSQVIPLQKIVRKLPIVQDCNIVKKFIQKIDNSRFEHFTELLVSPIDNIFKMKSKNIVNGQQKLVIEGEYNEPEKKCFAVINGERTKGQLVIDLINKSANLVLNGDELQHQTRIVRTSEKYYSLESMTSHKQRPVFKLNGKVSSLIFSEPEHLFARRSSISGLGEHVSTFEAVIFEPKEYVIRGEYDCLKKELSYMIKDTEDKRFQQTVFKYDDITGSLNLVAKLDSPIEGESYNCKARINVPGLLQEDKCNYNRQACKTEIIYSSDKSGQWMAKYVPGEPLVLKQGRQLVDVY